MSDYLPGGFKDIKIKPVGHVRTSLKDPLPLPQDGDPATEEYIKRLKEYNRRIKDLESELVIFPELEDILEGIEDFSHILVPYCTHVISEERRKTTLQVHPMGKKDMPKKGIFATCSPIGPDSILLSTVRLVSRKGNVLVVKGLEALNGSPILDIKPYILGYHNIEDSTIPEWMKKLREESEDIS